MTVTYGERLVGHHTLYEPVVARGDVVLLDLRGTGLDPRGDVTYPAPGVVRLRLRRFPHGSAVVYDLVVDTEAGTFAVDGGPALPLAAVHDVVRELRPLLPSVLAADLAAARCPLCGGHLRRAGVSAFDTGRPFECEGCSRIW